MQSPEWNTVWSGLERPLPLSASRRAEIRAELGDHVTEHMLELCAQGRSREEAARQALGELGSADDLAAAIAEVCQEQRTRWIMRATMGSTVGMVALAVGLLTFWPDDGRDGLKRGLQAQDIFATGDAPATDDRTAATEKILATRLDADFFETPLSEVLDYLHVTTNVQFYVNRRQLDDEGLDVGVPVTIKLHEVRVDMLLELILGQVGLQYMLRDGIVMISTESDVQLAAEVRVYDVRDLLHADTLDFHDAAGGGGQNIGVGPGGLGFPPGASGLGAPGSMGLPGGGGQGGGFPGAGGMGSGGGGGGGMGGFGGGGPVLPMPAARNPRAQALIETLTTTIVPDSWEQVGGAATVAEYGGLLVINHHAAAHRKIEALFRAMRSAIEK